MEDENKYLWAPIQKEEDYISDQLSEHAQQYAKQKAAEQVIRQTQADIIKRDKTKAEKALQILSSGPNGKAIRSLIPGAALTTVGLPEIGVPMMTGAGVDQAVKTFTPYESVGDGVAQSLGIRPYNNGYGFTSFAGELLNPGFFVSPNTATKFIDYIANAPKATIEANAIGRTNDAIAQRAIDAQVPLNWGWGPKQTLNVTRAGAYDQMYYPQRWDVVQEGANPNGLWLQGKLGTPRTEATHPGKGLKAARARNTFSTRPEQYKGTITLDKPMITVGDVPNRSSLSWQADQMGADGLVYNNVYDNGYNNNQVILSFKKPELTRIGERPIAEWLGLSKGDRGNLSQEQLDALKDLKYYIDVASKKKIFGGTSAEDLTWRESLAPEESEIIYDDASRPLKAYRTKDGYIKTFSKEPGSPFSTSYSYGDPNNFGDVRITADPKRHASTIVLTSPRVDAMVGELTPEQLATLSDTVDKDIMRTFWKRAKQITRPGTYVSGDTGNMPLGFTLMNDFDTNQKGKLAQDLLYKKYTKAGNSKDVTRSGLSPDSFSSLVRQGLRDGNQLRWGEPFYKWNDSAVKNSYVYDAYTKYLNKEIPAEQYLSTVNDWLESIGANKFAYIDGENIMVPHPFVLYKQGGILKRVETGKSGIKIKSKNKGKFTETKKRTGKTTEELTHSKNPLTRKRAIFAQNAKKWNHK